MKHQPQHHLDRHKQPDELVSPQSQQRSEVERNRHDKSGAGQGQANSQSAPALDTRDGLGVKPEPGAKLGRRHGDLTVDDDEFGTSRR